MARITDDEKKFAKKLLDQINEDDDDRILWKEKLIHADRIRQGLVKIRNWPWPGAAEFTIPFTDKTISKTKSVNFLSLLGNKKWVVAEAPFGSEMTPELQEICDKQQLLANSMLRDPKQKFVKKTAQLLDNLAEKGKFAGKVREKVSVRPVKRTLFVEAMIESKLRFLVRAGVVDPNKPFNMQDTIKSLKNQKNVQLYPFLIDRFGFDLDDAEDKKLMDSILSRFRRGEKEIEFEDKQVTKREDLVTILPENVIYPKDTTDIQETIRRAHEFWMSKQRLLQLAEQGVFDMSAVKDLSEDGDSNSESFSKEWELNRSETEGITNSTTKKGLHRVIESYTWWKKKRYVFTYLPDQGGGRLLRKPQLLKTDFPDLDEVEWPFFEHNLEVKDNRYYSSRGLPEKLASVQSLIDMSINNMVNRDIINNTPMFMVSSTSDFSERQIRFIPGQVIRVKDGEIRPFNAGSAADISSDRISQIAKAFGEEYVGSTDFTFNNATNTQGARTATEITRAAENAAPLLQMDTSLLFDTFSNIANMLFSIKKQNFKRPIFINGVKITKADLEVPCILRWNGSVEQADKALQTQKSLNRVQVLAQFKQEGTIVNDEDMYNALQDWLDNDDNTIDPDRYTTRPEQQLTVASNQMKQGLAQGQQQLSVMQEEAVKLEEEIAKSRKVLIAVKEDIDEAKFKNNVKKVSGSNN